MYEACLKTRYAIKELEEAKRLINNIRHSGKATEVLIKLANKTVLCPTKVRWSSTFIMIERLLQLRPHLAAVCDAQWWDPLQQSTWEVLHNLRDLMTPLATATEVLGRETGEALSRVFEQVTGIENHLLVFAEN